MDRNRLEACQEEEAAKKLMMCNEFASAREHLIRAKQLFPGIDNISSMLTVCDILSAASIKLPDGGLDYYWILQLSPSSTLDAITYRHQKLVSMLQPIRRTFPGTELALKHIHDAFTKLSEKEARFRFDSKRGASWENYSSKIQASSCRSISEKVIMSIATAQSSSEINRNSYSQIPDGNKKTAEVLSEAVDSVKKPLDFGENDYQCSKSILQVLSQCTADLNSLDGAKTRAGKNVSSEGLCLSRKFQPNILEENGSSFTKAVVKKRTCLDFYDFDNDRQPDCLGAGQICATHYTANLHHNYRYAQINSKSKLGVRVTWLKPIPVSHAERRWCDAGLPVACGSFELDPEMRDEISRPVIPFCKCSWIQGLMEKQFDIYPKRGEIWAVYKDFDLEDWSNDPDAVKQCKFLLVEIISEFSKYLGADVACLVKVNGFSSIFERKTMGGNPDTFHISPSNFYMFSHNVPAYIFRGGEIEKVAAGMFELDRSALPADLIQDIDSQQAPDEKTIISSSQIPFSIASPKNRLLMPGLPQKYFTTGQVWAIYCGKDVMPRQYIRIDNIISESQARATLLEPLPSLEHEILWKKENLPITCGIFKVSGTSVTLQISMFSYLVRCQQSPCKSLYKIYPVKGEIWAMYKSWSPKWQRADHDKYHCRVVQILSDFGRDGIRAAKLTEVKGCLTFFRRLQYDGFDLIHAASREEMLSFSHRIPAFRVPGIEKYGIPENSWHLEPDALPPKRGN